VADKSFQLAFDGNTVSDVFYSDVLSLTIEEDVNTATTLRLQMATALGNDGGWSHQEDDQLALYSRVSAKIGFTGGSGLGGALGSAASSISGALGGPSGGDDGLIPVFDGYITEVKIGLGSDPGSSTVDVTALDTSVLLSLEEKVATFDNMSDSDIVQQIVSAYGITAQTDFTATVHQDNDTTVVQRGSDLAFVRSLAARNGMEFYFETDPTSGDVVAYFQQPQLSASTQPDLAVQFGEGSNLQSFSATLNGQRPLSVKALQTDVRTASPNSAQVLDTQLTKLGATDGNSIIGGPLNNLVTPQDTQAQMLLLAVPTSDATELQTIAQAVRDEAAWVITASGEVNTDAYQSVLRPHRVVLIKGGGTPYSGKYYVTKVTHEMKVDGSYTQTFEARRNARDVDGSEDFGSSSLGIAVPGV
jgi:phage protein D